MTKKFQTYCKKCKHCEVTSQYNYFGDGRVTNIYECGLRAENRFVFNVLWNDGWKKKDINAVDETVCPLYLEYLTRLH